MQNKNTEKESKESVPEWGDLYLMYGNEAGTMNIHSIVRQVGARASGQPGSLMSRLSPLQSKRAMQAPQSGKVPSLQTVYQSPCLSRTVFADGTAL